MTNKIKIGGKTRPYSFGWNAIEVFCDTLEIPVKDLGKALKGITKGNFELKIVRVILYSGLKAEELANGIESKYNAWKVGQWIDEMDQEELNKAMEIFAVSLPNWAEKAKKMSRKQ